MDNFIALRIKGKIDGGGKWHTGEDYIDVTISQIEAERISALIINCLQKEKQEINQGK